MHFDDRLATVLRSGAGSERAARTQYRQILDLVGSAPVQADEDLIGHALDRLQGLARDIPADERALVVREPALRLRNPRLVAWLAQADPPVAQAAMARARLTEDQWRDLIPALPITARGLLRHREDLPRSAKGMLARLGVRDLVLPQPDVFADGDQVTESDPAESLPLEPQEERQGAEILELRPDQVRAATAKAADSSEVDSEIGVLMRRIDAFNRARKGIGRSTPSPRLPLGDAGEERLLRPPPSFDFSTDTEGRINWAETRMAPMLVGLSLLAAGPSAAAHPCRRTRIGLTLRQPVRGGSLELQGAPAIAGRWRVDASPHFNIDSGAFTGFRGRMRLLPAEYADASESDHPQAEIMRTMLHELRTPVNAIQGFAEVIQQQVFGPAPNEYRALAAAIGVDVARIQAGFDELDRLARLEMGALTLEEGESDFGLAADEIVRRLQGALRSRGAGFIFNAASGPLPVPMVGPELQQLCWRLLATIAASVAPGEMLDVALTTDAETAQLTVQLPTALEERENLFASTDPLTARAVTSGMFGSGFTMRLAKAEALAAGGGLEHQAGRITLKLPLSTAQETLAESERAGN